MTFGPHTRSIRVGCVALGVAACGAPLVRPVEPVEPPGPRSCPPASEVRYAIWSIPGAWEIENGPPGMPATGFWRFPVGFRQVDDGAPSPGPVAREDLDSLGLESVPDALYVLAPDAPPCRVQIAGYLGELVDDGVANVRVSAIATECPRPEAREMEGWAVPDDPAGCRLSLPGARVATLLVEDATGVHLPASIPPVPSPYAAALPPQVCEPPCTTLWSIRVVDGPTALAEVWATYLVPGAPDDRCNWEYEDHAGLYAVRTDGIARPLPYPAIDLGDVPPRTLAGALVDASGTRVVLLTDHARWGAYELEPSGALGLGRMMETYFGVEEDGIFRSLAPNCGP